MDSCEPGSTRSEQYAPLAGTGWTFAIAAVLLAGMATADDALGKSNPPRCQELHLSVSLNVAARAGLSASQTDAVRREVERIWSPFGVIIVWDGPDPINVAIDRPADPLPRTRDERRWPLASIRFEDGLPTRSVYVSVDAVAEVVRRAPHPHSLAVMMPRTTARVAARVIAHELGHYVLVTAAHSTKGLMRPTFSPEALVDTQSPLDVERHPSYSCVAQRQWDGPPEDVGDRRDETLQTSAPDLEQHERQAHPSSSPPPPRYRH